jgi:hypothetical protein
MSGIFSAKGRTLEQQRQNRLTKSMGQAAYNAALNASTKRNINRLKKVAQNRKNQSRLNSTSNNNTRNKRRKTIMNGIKRPISPMLSNGTNSARSNITTSTTSNTSSIFFAPSKPSSLQSSPRPLQRMDGLKPGTYTLPSSPSGGKRRTYRHKKHAKRTRKH